MLFMHRLALAMPRTQYVIAVTSTSGTITDSTPVALGTPNSDIATAMGFIQLRLYTFDDDTPTTANVEVSLDSVSYSLVGVAKEFQRLGDCTEPSVRRIRLGGQLLLRSHNRSRRQLWFRFGCRLAQIPSSRTGKLLAYVPWLTRVRAIAGT